MAHPLYPAASAEIAERRRQLAPATHDAFRDFSRQVFADGAGGAYAHSALALDTASQT